MFGLIQQRCQDYYDNIPTDTFSTIVKSAIFSFTACVLINYQPYAQPNAYIQPLISAGVAAMAALIHAITTPIFNAAFGDNNQITWYREMIKCFVITALTRVLIHSATGHRVEVMQNRHTFISWNLLKSGYYIFSQCSDCLGFTRNATLNVIQIAQRLGVETRNGSNSTYIICDIA